MSPAVIPDPHKTQFDILIIGGGLVGAAFAQSLAGSNLSIGLLESRPPTAPSLDAQEWDSRVYAISPANARFLGAAWQAIPAERVAPIHQMDVRGDRPDARLNFDAIAAGRPELGWIIESRQLQYSLWQSLTEQSNLTLITGQLGRALTFDAETANLELADGSTYDARLIVGADGAQSWTRQQAGIDINARPYLQQGVVANFQCEKPHGNVARQWFLPDGILAWLPLPDQRISIVWSCFEEQAKGLLALDFAGFTERVAAAGHHALGQLQLLTAPAGFPLRLMRAQRWVAPRLALIGDAAHNVHPLAGQGVNLGFQDAEELARVLRAREAERDCGELGLLRRYERARQEDTLAMQTVTDSLQKLFNNSSRLLTEVRNTGLQLVENQHWIKRTLMRHAFG